MLSFLNTNLPTYSSLVVDSSGYMSPEYAMRGQFSMKSDVYSFGVLVLEIISGRKNTSFDETNNSHDLVTYVSLRQITSFLYKMGLKFID